MKILHVIDVFAPVGGKQTYVHAVTEMQATAGHEIAILHGDHDASAPSGVVAEEYGSPGVARWIETFNPDVVHVHGSALPPGLRPTAGAYPAVHSLHDFGSACASGTKYFRSGRICSRAHGAGCLVAGLAKGCNHRIDPRSFLARYRTIERELPMLRAATSIVVHSNFMRSFALANHLPNSNVNVVPYFVKRPAETPSPTLDRTVAFAGRVVPDKGLDVLLEALASCSPAWDRLLVAGDGWDRERCVRIAHRRGIATKVSFLGHIDGAAVRSALVRARVVAVPSRWPEPFGIVGLEAMAQRRPVVASGVGGIPEWLEDGQTGLMVPPDDALALAAALVSLLDDTKRANAMGDEGWRRVSRFSPEHHLRELVSVYEQAAGARRESVTVGGAA